MILIFESINLVKQIALPDVGLIPSDEGMTRTKMLNRRNSSYLAG